MDQLIVKNPLTNRTPKEAIANLRKKGYFTGVYQEAQHASDPDIITLVTMRCQIATKDIQHANYIYDNQEKESPLRTHYPHKPQEKTMLAINHIMKDQYLKLKEQAEKAKANNKAVHKHCLQLSLLDDFNQAPKLINEKLIQIEIYENNAATAFINGELSQKKFVLFTQYFKELEKYYQGDQKIKPKLVEQEDLDLLQDLKDYEIQY